MPDQTLFTLMYDLFVSFMAQSSWTGLYLVHLAALLPNYKPEPAIDLFPPAFINRNTFYSFTLELRLPQTCFCLFVCL